jgi:4,5-DOPA dioxygenase extradiol
MSRMPAAFIGHGSPMNTLETNRFTSAWRAFGASVPRPRAVLAISAHWYINGTAVTAMPQPRIIHDFFGFPPRLFEFQYPAPGSPEVAAEVAETLGPEYVGLDRDSWGIDHGTWSVLAHVFPAAEIPVVQLSIHAAKPAQYHFELGRRLAPLRERGVLILGSGNVVHNLRLIQFRQPELAYDWAERFDAAVKDTMTREPAGAARMESHPDYARSVPTPEHWLPLLYLAGLCDAAGERARPWAEGCTMGSISMTSYVLGDASPAVASAWSEGAASLPDPDLVPPEATNT